MQDGVLFAELNRQGGPRGGKEFVAPNWWMGMATRNTSRGLLTFTSMMSLDPATLGEDGYREIFQVGETVDGEPLVDHQHPHDFFMQLAGVWRIPLSSGTALTIAGGPVGEPALGPVAFMHRASAAENPLAALSHHTFDSTHIAFGVVTAAIDRGRWVLEGSVFNGREPDEDRWDFDFGALDSVSGRVWFRPAAGWEVQVSTGRLREPEALEPGNVQRTTMSGSWLEQDGEDFTAVTVGYGVNATDHGRRHALFGEVARRGGLNSVYARGEVLQTEIAKLLSCGSVVHCWEGDPVDEHRRDALGAITIGGVRDVLRWRGFEGGLGASVTFYAVPAPLEATHGSRPASFQLFFRLRPPAGSAGRMRNMRMSSGHGGMLGSGTP